MYALILLLAAACGPSHRDLAARLDDADFRTRQTADAELRRRLTWPAALRLDAESRLLGTEGRFRVRRILDAFYRRGLPVEMPHIDALTNSECSGCLCRVSQDYYRRAFWLVGASPNCLAFRTATAMLVDDLVAARMPPPLIRWLVWLMEAGTRRWESRQQWQRMPQPPDGR